MPKFLEDKLKAEYGANSKIPYKVMNKMGVMRGSKITAKGRAMEKKHAADMGQKAKPHTFTGEAHSYDFRRPKRKVMSRYTKGQPA